jgi:hypothetical protein
MVVSCKLLLLTDCGMKIFSGMPPASQLTIIICLIDRGPYELAVRIGNNREFIPDFGEGYRQGEAIHMAFVESTVNQLVSKRLVKKQQMQWTLRSAHLLLQMGTKVLNGELEQVFRGWYRMFRAQVTQA